MSDPAAVKRQYERILAESTDLVSPGWMMELRRRLEASRVEDLQARRRRTRG